MAQADFFLLDGLKRQCEELVAGALTPANVLRCHENARRHAAAELQRACEHFVAAHLPALLSQPAFAAAAQADGGLLAAVREQLRRRLLRRVRVSSTGLRLAYMGAAGEFV